MDDNFVDTIPWIFVEKMTVMDNVLALAGGVGGSKLVVGLSNVVPTDKLTVVVNTGDDDRFHGLHVSPDIDTVMYALAGMTNETTGWGLNGDSFRTLERLQVYGADVWFQLGDLDLATHIRRTELLDDGATLAEVTKLLCMSIGIKQNIAPMTDGRVRTVIDTDQGLLSFQEYFVKNKCIPAVRSLRFEGAESCTSSPALDHALDKCDILVICPSNPFLSVRPILAIPGVKVKIQDFNGVRVVVSPIVNGKAIKGPAGKMLEELGYNSSAVGVAQQYKGLCDIFVIDRQDIDLATQIESLGLQVLVADTVMANKFDKIKLAEDILGMCGL